MRLTALVLVAALWPGVAPAQSRTETLADIRAQLAQLGASLAGLKQELMTTGAISQPGGYDMLSRMEAIEIEMMRLTGKTEDLELRVNRVVSDAENRLGDLEFRVVELEGGDVSALSAAPVLGGSSGGASATAPAGTPQLTVGEQADFDRARGVLGQGDFQAAADLFAAYAQTWPTSPLSGEALHLRGEALEALGDLRGAARAWLDSFSSYPDAPRAPESLVGLGRALGQLGQINEACLTLAEVPLRYPSAEVANDRAVSERLALACP